jgi:HEAT repeat protein
MPSLFSDDPIESMEAAKKIIGGHVKADPVELAQIAEDKGLTKWPRISAIYTLGFTGEEKFAPLLRGILADAGNDADIRSYAAEALGNIGDRGAAMLLKDILGSASETKLRESCEYALEELESV